MHVRGELFPASDVCIQMFVAGGSSGCCFAHPHVVLWCPCSLVVVPARLDVTQLFRIVA
jgi:hypothetical protein